MSSLKLEHGGMTLAEVQNALKNIKVCENGSKELKNHQHHHNNNHHHNHEKTTGRIPHGQATALPSETLNLQVPLKSFGNELNP